MKKKMLIIGDSMAMPRPGIAYEVTWVYKLINSLPEYEFIDRMKRASTTERLVTEGGGGSNPKGADLLEHYMPDVIIMQIGITDCAPRYIKKHGLEYLILRIIPDSMRKRYIDLVKKYRIRDPQKAYISPSTFRHNLADFFQRATYHKVKIIAILIAPVTSRFVDKSPHINQNIKIYNDIFYSLRDEFENVYVVQPFDQEIDLEDIAIDEYHVNPKGHDIIFRMLLKQLCPT